MKDKERRKPARHNDLETTPLRLGETPKRSSWAVYCFQWLPNVVKERASSTRPVPTRLQSPHHTEASLEYPEQRSRHVAYYVPTGTLQLPLADQSGATLTAAENTADRLTAVAIQCRVIQTRTLHEAFVSTFQSVCTNGCPFGEPQGGTPCTSSDYHQTCVVCHPETHHRPTGALGLSKALFERLFGSNGHGVGIAYVKPILVRQCITAEHVSLRLVGSCSPVNFECESQTPSFTSSPAPNGFTLPPSGKSLWDLYDRLQAPLPQITLRETLRHTLLMVDGPLTFNVLGLDVEFEVFSLQRVDRDSATTEAARLSPHVTTCIRCQKSYSQPIYVLPQAEVTILPPLRLQHKVSANAFLSLETSHISASASRGLSSVGGRSSIVRELCDTLLIPLAFPSLFASLGISPPKGVLLHGPPGTGKTHLARAIAEEIQVNWEAFCSTYAPRFDKMSTLSPSPPAFETLTAADILNSGAETAVHQLFQRCRERYSRTRCSSVIFIDEFDVLCPERSEAGHEEKKILSAFLTNLDGLTQSSGVVLLGATNRPHILDPALRRAGRLDREIEVDVPSGDDRVAILTKLLEQTTHNLTREEIESIAWDCHAFVAADLKGLCTIAGLKAIQEALPASPSPRSAGSPPSPSITLHHMHDALKHVGPSAMKALAVEVPHVKWNDIGGYNNVKKTLQECVEWPIKYREIFTKLATSPPRGVLLYGPPGCSKTLLAKAVATESKMNFIAVKGPELFSKWVGESERAVREVFRKARQNAPCVVFFDEIDALGTDRQASDGGSGVESRVLSQMLNELDGINSLKQVVTIGATNRPDLLDAALLRPGRLDRLVYVPLPDYASRAAIIRVHLKKMISPTDATEPTAIASSSNKATDRVIDSPEEIPKDLQVTDPICLSDDAQLENGCFAEIINRTEGYSGAEIAMICREAKMLVLRQYIASVESQYDAPLPSLKISLTHVLQSLELVRPRIPKSLIQFYETYHAKHAGIKAFGAEDTPGTNVF